MYALTAGRKASISVLSPICAWLRVRRAVWELVSISPNVAASIWSLPSEPFAIPRKNIPYNGPIAPPMLFIKVRDTTFIPCVRPPGFFSSSVLASPKPLFMFTPWSPSPIAPSMSLRR